MSINLHIIVFISTSISTFSSADYSFSDVKALYLQRCQAGKQQSTANNGSTECCGYCSLDSLSSYFHSCHFLTYDNFPDAIEDEVFFRRRCIAPEIVTQKGSEFRRYDHVSSVLMRTGCNEEFPGYDSVSYLTREFCENPRLGYKLDSLLPVNYMVDAQMEVNTIYRNIYCLQCSNVIYSWRLSHWSMDLRCREAISFSVDLAETAVCNIFFNPPTGQKVEKCPFPSFKISECNVTGLWIDFDRSIEDACYSFTDPFNNTYKNYFCYLCNTDTPVPNDQWSCKEPYALQEHLEPPFSYTFGSEILQSTKDIGLLKCNSETQFKDSKLMVCRDIKCAHHGYLRNCMPKSFVDRDICFVLFIKFTFGAREIFYESNLTDSSFLDAVKYTLAGIIKSEELQGMRIYKSVSYRKGNVVIDYLVVKINIEYSGYFLLREASIIAKIHGRFCYVGNEETTYFRIPLCELATYDYVSASSEDLLVPRREDMSTETLEPVNTGLFLSGLKTCKGKEIRFVSKLDYCIQLDLRQSEMAMAVSNSFLIIKGSSKEFVFTRWEYAIHGDSITICLEDYLPVYNDIAALSNDDIKSKQGPSSTACQLHSHLFLFILTEIVILVIYKT